MLPKNLETLKNMNSSTSKFAKWYVRVIAPKIIDYPIKARGEPIAAQKFECVLVSKDSAQYMLGLVPFAFNDRGAAQKAMDKFTENHVFEITQPAFDTKAKSEFNGCPVKNVLFTMVNTAPKCYWLTNYLETLRVEVWYPMTVATNSREQKTVIK